MNERIKIKLFQKHFANVDADFLHTFSHQTGIINIISFIKKSCYDDFGFYLENKEDLVTLDEYLKHRFYKDKSEWLREKMRDELCRKMREKGGL